MGFLDDVVGRVESRQNGSCQVHVSEPLDFGVDVSLPGGFDVSVENCQDVPFSLFRYLGADEGV